MNIASDGGDEASPAAEIGETARTVTIALITKMGKVSAGLQLNGATFRLNLLRCSLERHCQTKFYTACLGVGTRVSSTVFAEESPPRSARFEAENGLYLFALTVPVEGQNVLEALCERADALSRGQREN
jgi:hypothetical protein